MSIGIFDSGVGGLTVMREVAKRLPYEDLIYLGDTARVPYGNRSPEVIQEYTREMVNLLLKKKIHFLVIACHTISAHSLELLQKELPIPVVGVIESCLRQLKSCKKRVGILGTESTIASGIYQKRICEQFPHLEVFPQACPLFVPLIEQGLFEHPSTYAIAHHYLEPLREKKMDAVLLACTHYPFIYPMIQQILGRDVLLIEAAHATALEVEEYLTKHKLKNEIRKSFRQFFVTGTVDQFVRCAKQFFGEEMQEINCKKIEISGKIFLGV